MRVRRFVRWMTRGRTTPGLFVDDLGQGWVVKPSGRTFRDGLIEWVASRLAGLLEIPTPEACVLDTAGLVRTLARADSDLARLAQALESGGGLAFGSRWTPGADWVAPLEPPAEELRALGALRVFDRWVANADRRPDNPNLIVTRRLLAIDHAQALPWIYGTNPRVTPHVSDAYAAHIDAMEGSSRARAALARLDPSAIRRAIGAVPIQWVEDAELDDLSEALAERAREIALEDG